MSLRFQDSILGHLFGVSLEQSAEFRMLTLSKHMNADHVRDAFKTIAFNRHLYPWWSFPFWRRSICSFHQRKRSNLAGCSKSYMTRSCENTRHLVQSRRIWTLETMQLSMSRPPLFPTHICRVSEFSRITYPAGTMRAWKDRRSENMGIDMETMVIKRHIAAERSIGIHGSVI